MSRIVIFGGSGHSGGNIAREAVGRGHDVISYSRTAPQSPGQGMDFRIGSMADEATLRQAATDADTLVVAVHALDVDGVPLVDRLPAVVDAAVAGGASLGFVGGAGSSLVADGRWPRASSRGENLPPRATGAALCGRARCPG